MSHARLLSLLLVGVMLASVTAAWGAVLGITPVRIHLSAKRRSELVELKNTSQELARYQVVAHAWRETPDGQMELRPTQDLIFFPSLFEVKPGETRRVRVASNRAPGGIERSYRLVVEELPKGQKPGEVQVLTNLSIPVFVQPGVLKTTPKLRVAARGGRILVSVENDGNSYFKAQSVRVVARSGNGASVFDQTITGWYVLAGARRVYTLDVPKDVCGKMAEISATVRTENDKASVVTAVDPGVTCKRE